MSYNTVRIKIEDGNDVIVRGPFDVLDGGLSYESTCNA